jgi:hypothetical protein
MLDIIFLSYDEPYADNNFAKLQERFPYAKRVANVKGIDKAHLAASKKANTTFFYVVDADNEVRDDFNFDYKPEDHKKNYVHIWRAYNPAINLSYGYGGVKLFSRKFFKTMQDEFLDFSTTLTKDIEIMNDTVSDTVFYKDPMTAFRSGFREATKLYKTSTANPDKEQRGIAADRLNAWCNPRPVENAKIIQQGAWAGITNAMNFGTDKYIDINDFEKITELSHDYR